jgi:hypothetical protein
MLLGIAPEKTIITEKASKNDVRNTAMLNIFNAETV